MSAIGAMTRWEQPCPIGTMLAFVWPFRVVARGWCGVTQTLRTSHDVELRGRVHVVSTTVRVTCPDRDNA